LLALSVKTSDADLLPVADGLNVTLTVQVFVGVTVWLLQVSAVLVKSPEFVPLMATEEIVRFALPVLVSVSVSAALVKPSDMFPKLRLDGESVTAGTAGAGSIPTRSAICHGPEPPFSVQLAVCCVLAATPLDNPSSAVAPG
jgi:hypothetical protein